MKISAKHLSAFWIGLTLFARLASGPTANLSFILLGLYALVGRAQAIQALGLTWFFSMLNSNVFPAASQGTVGRYIAFAAAAASVLLRADLWQGKSRVRRPVILTVVLGIFVVGHSLFFSPIMDVSILKAVSWTVVMVTLIAAWEGLKVGEMRTLEWQMFWGLTAIMGVSFLLMAMPAAYMPRGELRGVLGHSQALGPTMGFLAAWAGCRVISTSKPPWLIVAVFGGAVVMVMLSGARTAGLGFVGGVAIGVMLSVSRAPYSMRTLFPGLRSQRTAFLMLLAAIGLVSFAPRIGNVIGDFIMKGRSDTANIVESYEESRGGLIEVMWENIEDNPFAGIGFGIASEPFEMRVEREPLLGLPVGAAVEKGVMPVAVLEEIGVVGFLLVAFWVVFVFRKSIRSGVEPTAIVATAMLFNLGEATLFSAGGMGLLSLILIGWALARPPAQPASVHR